MNEQHNLIIAYLMRNGFGEQAAIITTYSLATVLVFLAALLVTWIVRITLIRFITHIIHHNSLHWDDALVHNNVLRRLSWLVPVVIFNMAKDMLLPPDSQWIVGLEHALTCAFIIVTLFVITALLDSINDIYRAVRGKSGKTIRGYIDAFKIIAFLVCSILIIAVLTERSPWGLLSVMGGLTAVTMLVFRDSILGFIASIQLTATDMIRVGDWIEMESHGADGDIIELTIHTVKVRNFDKTITTIPTYALISQSFKNWRGMRESGGRRIKRSLYIDMTSIRFLDEEDLQRMAKIRILSEYVRHKQREINQHNRLNNTDSTDVNLNGRKQTNIGLFRAYVTAYMRHHQKIHQDMTFLVRHLQPGPNGLPLELYVFSKDQEWAVYESIQADIFDHLLAILPYFDLRIFQQPSGFDLRHLTRGDVSLGYKGI